MKSISAGEGMPLSQRLLLSVSQSLDHPAVWSSGELVDVLMCVLFIGMSWRRKGKREEGGRHTEP